ncbi:putative E3 ubiquitin-protein ligase RF298 isoform X1 [Dendrobium catenatum]|uniref:E3 ubiquitin-protein ligase RF298 n=1 Tax=Dendrobium catenatum TaxID=906689 RepID=A0A2I0WM39_9ASPA|nr:putative E3 ubiquitin-protein ligase RF298 isoform X1 [Dendrobium catenatum]XP_020684132.1 putative E3 ubiquitin-protein ligase RF298 isoform X1 [Dendrobium catenatum]XP_020684133.1 putative E3 ubiquitin-protein ligase RF298 isoform X1 [Dendrobium catenatum]PKU76729.1 Putative E3 ubiquitin-protein ligase RF298 [Dendrobium catenatum]
MATMVTRGSSPLASSMSLREKGNRNKRKFRADPPVADSNILNPLYHVDCTNYDFFPMETIPGNPNVEQHTSFCDSCRMFSCGSKEELGLEALHEVDWSNLMVNKLEEIILSILNEVFNGAIKSIASHGYTEEVATNAVLSYGIFYRGKYTVSNIVDNALSLLRSGREVDSSPKENVAEDVQKLARSVLADMVNVLREVRPFFSVGDAMWCLLICDLNVSHACAFDSDILSGTCYDEKSSSSNVSQSEPEANSSISTSQTMPEVEVSVSRKIYHLNASKREPILREKSFHFEDHRANRSKATLRASKHGGIGGPLMHEKVKSIPDSSCVSFKCNSPKPNKVVGSHSLQTDESLGFSLSDVSSSSPSASMKESSSMEPLTTTNTDLSLSLLPSTSSSTGYGPYGIKPDTHSSCVGMGSDKINGNWIPHDMKDELLLKLIPRVRELEAQKQEWTEWAQHKIMQATHRLSKDKPDLQTLRQEKEEVARLKKEKQTLEENTKKKLIEMENALSKASNQIEEADVTTRRLDNENLKLRKEMEAAKLRAEESAASCQEVSKREMKILKKFQSLDRDRSLLQDELMSEKRKLLQLQQQFKFTREHHDLMQARWKQEHKAKGDVLLLLKSKRKEREQIEASGKSKENEITIEAEHELQRLKNDIRRLELQITQLRLTTDSSKMAGFGWVANGSYASRLADVGKSKHAAHSITKLFDIQDQGDEDLQRERECVMCMSEEVSVVFLPCAHQVICSTCNELHERQGMKDCPSCRTTIQRRISIRPAEFIS